MREVDLVGVGGGELAVVPGVCGEAVGLAGVRVGVLLLSGVGVVSGGVACKG